jgi:hypothetical protein
MQLVIFWHKSSLILGTRLTNASRAGGVVPGHGANAGERGQSFSKPIQEQVGARAMPLVRNFILKRSCIMHMSKSYCDLTVKGPLAPFLTKGAWSNDVAL